MDIVKATSAYEAWLGELTDVQTKAVARKHSEMAQDAFHLLRATFYRWVEHWETLCPELHSRNDHANDSSGASTTLMKHVRCPSRAT
jgi:hypothetical protein